jgi:uncharacterized membrane protein YfhO
MNKKLAYFIVIVAPFILFSPELLSGKSIFWGLPILQFYPWHELSFDLILHGQIPLWNSYNGLGTPLFANYQSALFYPGTWFIFLFYIFGKLDGLVWGHLIVNILHLSLAGVGIIKIAEHKKYSYYAAILSALSFSLGGYFLARFGFFSMIWAGAWYPWIFFFTLKIAEKKKYSVETIKLSIVSTLLLLSGHAQLCWYILLFSVVYLIFQYRRPMAEWFRIIIQFVLANLLAVGISAIQLLPTAELLLHSQRSDAVNMATSMTYSFWPWHFLNFLNPHIFGHPISGDYWGYAAYWEDAVYIGLLPILLAISVIILAFRKKIQLKWENRDLYFFGTIYLVSIIFALGNNTSIFPWLYQYIPTFDMFNAPARYMIWFVFSASLFAGSAFDEWRKPEGKVLYWVRLGTAGGVAIGIGALFMLLTGDAIKSTFILATFQISLIIILIGVLYLLNPISDGNNYKNQNVWKIAVILFVFLDLFYMNYQHIPVDNVKSIQVFSSDKENNNLRIYTPDTVEYEYRYNKVLNFDDYGRTISNNKLAVSQLANINIFSRIVSLNNFEPMRLSAYDEFIHQLNKKSKDDQILLLGKCGINQIGEFTTDHNNVEHPEIFVYEDISALNPIQFYTHSIEIPSVDSMLDVMADHPCVYIPSKTGKSTPTVNQECETLQGKVSDLIWYGSRISFTVDINQESWVLVNDTYDTGWKLTIDGKAKELYQANGFVKAFVVPAGKHNIELRYIPLSFILGSVISFTSLILMSILVYRIRRTP